MNKFTPLQIRVFLGTFAAVFFLVAAQQIGISLQSFISPIPEEKEAMDLIKPKLLEKQNTFSLKRQARFVPQAAADTGHDFDEASAYVIMDFETGEVIAEKNLSEKQSIASITKVMTAVVILDLVDPKTEFVVTERASEIIPTKIGVVPGQRLTVKELLEASLLVSANDAVEVLREGIDALYSESVFVQAMNQKAKYMGIHNTSFTNPQGFDNMDHYSTVEDVAILGRYAMTKYPLIAEIVNKDYLFLPEDSNHKQYDLYNWNGLIGVYPNVSGIKIGNTDDAGKTTLVVAERSGKKLLVVLLGAPGVLERDLWAADLLDLGFAKTMGLEPVAVTPEMLREKYSTWKYGK